MKNAPRITIGTEKQIAYARDLFEKRGHGVRAKRAELAEQFTALADQCKENLGATIPKKGVVVDQAVIDRCYELAHSFNGGAESHAAYWIESDPLTESLEDYVLTGVATQKMAKMGLIG